MEARDDRPRPGSQPVQGGNPGFSFPEPGAHGDYLATWADPFPSVQPGRSRRSTQSEDSSRDP